MTDDRADPAPARRIAIPELRASTAASRCLCYAACSELVASPHDIDVTAALGERAAACEALAHARVLGAVIAEVCAADLSRLRSDYSRLFEVGSDGPPVPVREAVVAGAAAGSLEEIVRFYSHFGYSLAEKFAWQPDHLSVELEFMHFLCYQEAQSDRDPRALPFQLAQLDFLERHPGRWVPAMVTSVEALAPGSLYSRVLAALGAFLASDLAWQRSTLAP